MNAHRWKPSNAQIATLILAPLLLIVARTQLVPYEDDAGTYIGLVAEDPARSDLGASLVIIAALLLIPAVLTLAGIARGHAPRLTTIGGAMAVIGCVGMACIATAALVAGQAVRLGPQSAAANLWDQVWNESKIWPILLVHIGAIGCIVLAITLYRSGLVPRVAAVLVGIGGATTMSTAAGPIRGALIGTAALALIGFTWVARSVWPASGSPAETASPRHPKHAAQAHP